MPAPVLQFKRGAFSNLPGLRVGEPGFTTDKYDFYVGLTSSLTTNKFFGSARYWKREDATNAAQLRLVDKDGSNFIAIAASDTLSGIATYRLPNTTNGTAGDFLKLASTTGGVYSLEWAQLSGSFTLAGDTGTDTFNTGETLTFTGGTNINSAVTNNTVTFNLDDDINISGIGTFGTGARIDGVQIGISGANVIDTVSGNLTLNSAGGSTIIDDAVTIQNNLVVNGNVTVGGTTVTLRGEDVFIENKDIILGFTTSITPNDDTANHAGVAIASTIGSPLVSFDASGINTLPSTYKQLMWFKSGTLGFSTDAFAFNYGLAIGTTTMANGVRLAVGSGITMSDNAITVTDLNTNSSTASLFNVNATTVNAFQAATNIVIGATTGITTFQNSVRISDFLYDSDNNNGTPGQFLTVTGAGVSWTTIAGVAAGTISTAARANTVDTVTASDTAGTYYVTFVNSHNGSATPETVYTDDGIYYNPGTNTFTTQHAAFTGNVTVNGTLTGTATTATTVTTTGTSDNATYYAIFADTSGGQTGETLRVGTALSLNASSGNVKAAGDLIAGSGYLASSNGTRSMYMYDTSGDVSFQGKVVANNFRSSSNASNTLTFTDLDASFARNLSIAGIATVGTSLSSPTIRTNLIKSSDTNTTAITITDNDVSVADNLTVGGNLFINGSTTQVNTTTLNVKDALVDLGLIDTGGGVLDVPTSDLNKDIGMLLNYYSGSAKKAAVFWDDSAGRIVFADDVTESSGVLTVASNAYASIEIESLWVNDCAGQSQVINCSGTTRTLENITIDCGTF